MHLFSRLHVHVAASVLLTRSWIREYIEPSLNSSNIPIRFGHNLPTHNKAWITIGCTRSTLRACCRKIACLSCPVNLERYPSQPYFPVMPIKRRSIRGIIVVSLIGVASAVPAYIASFYYSPEITVCEFLLTVEEGTVVIKVPLVAHDDSLPYVNSFYVYSHQNGTWKHPSPQHGGKGTMKSVIAMVNSLPQPNDYSWASNVSAGQFFGFGYCYSKWNPPERPGAVLHILAPLWTFFFASILGYLGISFGYLQYSIRLLLFLTVAVAILIGLIL